VISAPTKQVSTNAKAALQSDAQSVGDIIRPRACSGGPKVKISINPMQNVQKAFLQCR